VRVLSGRVVALADAEAPAARPLSELIASRVARLPDDERASCKRSPCWGYRPSLMCWLRCSSRRCRRSIATSQAWARRACSGEPVRPKYISPRRCTARFVLQGMDPSARQQLHARAAETYQRAALAPTARTPPSECHSICSRRTAHRRRGFLLAECEQKLAGASSSPPCAAWCERWRRPISASARWTSWRPGSPSSRPPCRKRARPGPA